MSFREITFDNSGKLVFSADDSTLYDFLLDQPDGIVKGIHDELEVIQNGLDLEVQDGYAIILGRVLAVDKDTIEAVSIPVATGDEEGYLIIKIDLNQAEGSQASITYKKAASLPSLVQEDLLNDGMIYEYPLYTFTQTIVGITSITDVRTYLVSLSDITDELKNRMNQLPNQFVVDAVYNVGNSRFEVTTLPADYVFENDSKLTIRFGSVTDIIELEELAKVFIKSTEYNIKLKDTLNQTNVRYIQSQIADLYKDTLDVIINRQEPVEAIQTEYDFPIQSQQTIVPVEASPFGDERIDGESAIQEIEHGDMRSDALTYWLAESNAILSLVNDRLRVTLGSLNYKWAYQEINLVAGKTYYFSANGFIGTGGWNAKILNASNGTLVQSGYQSSDGKYSVRYTALTTEIGKIALVTDEVVDGSYTEFDNVVFIPLLSVKQLAMSLSDLDKKYSVYFESLKSVENPEIKIVNKNLIDKNLIKLNTIIIAASGIEFGFDGSACTDFIRVKSSTSYKLSNNTSIGGNGGAYYDINKNYISGFGLLTSYTIPSNAAYIRITIDNDDVDVIQFEEGTVVTNHLDNNHSSKKYQEQILRGVTDGITDIEDYIDTVNNILHKLVGYDLNDVVQNATGWTKQSNAGLYTYFFKDLTGSLDYIVPIGDAVNTKKFLVIANNNHINGAWSDILGTEQRTVSLRSNGQLYISVLTSDLATDDTAGLETYLQANNVEFQFDINTEIITENIDSDGIAFAYKNMTIEIIQDNGFSNSWFARHALNDPETIRSLGKALQTAEKQITKLEDEAAANKAANEATQADLDLAELDIIDLQNDKVDKIAGKGLSENDYTDADKAAVTNNLVVVYDKVAITAGRFLSTDNIVAQTGNGWGAVFSADGDKLYILDSITDTIYQYQTKEPFGEIDTFDTSKALGTTLGIRGMVITEDGLKVIVSYIGSTNIESFTLGTSNDISTLSLASKVQKDVSANAPGGVRDIAISKDGLKFYYLEDGSDDTITYATFSSSFDISTLTNVNTFDGSSIDLVIEGIAITELGGKMLVLGANTDTIYEIIMSTLFSFSGAVESPDTFLIPDNPVSISITHGSGVVLIADPGANSIKRYMFATASSKLTDALVSLAP